MQSQAQVPIADPEARRRRLRPIAAAAALLAVAGILTGCLLPGAESRGSGSIPAPEPPQFAEMPPVVDPLPEPAPEAAETVDPPPAEQSPLPQVPEGEPSRFVAHVDRACKVIALTYDAGSGAAGAAAILDTLKKYDLKVTFFLTGKWAERFPALAQRIADEGHEIGNHTYSHPDLTAASDEEVLRQLADGEAAIRKATGKDPRPFFREPYGAFNEHERRLVRQAGYSYSIYWDVDTLDWQSPPVETLVSRIMKAQGGSIVLMHMNVPDTATASDQAIPLLQAKGYQIGTVSQLLRCEAALAPS